MADLLRDVDTIVIVLMENRSFDHVLGYLGLPPFNWAIEGIQKCNNPRYANPYNNKTYSLFQMSRLDMPHDPPTSGPGSRTRSVPSSTASAT
jgi:phospholipase C